MVTRGQGHSEHASAARWSDDHAGLLRWDAGHDRDSCDAYRLSSLSERRWLAGDIRPGMEFARLAARSGCCGSCGGCAELATIRLAELWCRVRDTDQALSILDAIDSAGSAPAGSERSVAATLVRANVLATIGDLSAAAELATTGLALARQSGTHSWLPVGHIVLAMASFQRGDMRTAVQYRGHLAQDSVFRRGMSSVARAAWATILITEAEQGAEAVAPLVAELAGPGPVRSELFISEPGAAPWLVRFALRTGEPALARLYSAHAARVASSNPDYPSVRAAALHAKGLLDDDVDGLRGAARRHRDRWSAASAMEDVGTLLARRHGLVEECLLAFEQAAAEYQAIGALRDHSRVKGRVRRLGVATGPTLTGTTQHGVAGLTEQEYAVAKLVAEGYTNVQAAGQLFLSRHTVAFHLRKIFRKLGVTSRVQLAAVWSELDAPPSEAGGYAA
ncbi:LuxR C-terminal-related transcriptional regulator [Actinoplanes sp. NPDC049265]|uniref:helix-turn-helix transcriptional regulator n=1 Tax=Actinoplanes sp. NPDC049265 TaxID=3363902 RepID=UPI003720CDE8